MSKKLSLILMMVSFLVIAGCSQKPAETAAGQKADAASADKTADVENDISNTGALEDDLNSDELDNIDKELEEVNW